MHLWHVLKSGFGKGWHWEQALNSWRRESWWKYFTNLMGISYIRMCVCWWWRHVGFIAHLSLGSVSFCSEWWETKDKLFFSCPLCEVALCKRSFWDRLETSFPNAKVLSSQQMCVCLALGRHCSWWQKCQWLKPLEHPTKGSTIQVEISSPSMRNPMTSLDDLLVMSNPFDL